MRDGAALFHCGGNPARLIRKRFDDDLIEYLLKLKWWDGPNVLMHWA
jgi:virginiamycin A acetyltransferase